MTNSINATFKADILITPKSGNAKFRFPQQQKLSP